MGDFRPITKWVGSGVNGKGDKFHWESRNFEVQIALVQEIWPFLALDFNSRMTSPIENLHFPRLISPELWQEKSCPPGFPIILGSSFKWDHFRPILWKLNRPHCMSAASEPSRKNSAAADMGIPYVFNAIWWVNFMTRWSNGVNSGVWEFFKF